jgi:hypothetical protein
VVVTYVDSSEHESATDSLGTIAAASEWKGGSLSWGIPGQWIPSGVPTANDNALVDVSGTYKLTVDVTAAAHSLVLNDTGATVEITRGHSLTLSGNVTILAGNVQIDSGGILKDIAHSATITGTFTDNGTVEVGTGDTLEVASTSISGSGVFKIDAGATLQLDHAIDSAKSVTFSGSGTLVLEDPGHFSGTVSDSTGSMTSGDILDLIGFDTSATVSYTGSSSGGTVMVTESSHATANIKVGPNSTHWTTTPVSDGHGGILIHDPPADDSSPASDGQLVSGVIMNDPRPAASSNDSLTIGHDGTSELAAGATTAVTFVDATGQLTLDDASSSNISISGFTGDGTLAGSDQIDLKGIDYNSSAFAESYDATKGLLSVSDGSKTATLEFHGSYEAANFKFVTDGHGGTIVYDPPVPTDAAHDLGGKGGFEFNFSSLGQGALQNAVQEVSDALAPPKDVLHLAGEAGPTPFVGGYLGPISAGIAPQAGTAMDPIAWHDQLKLLLPHTDLHV